MIDADLGGRRLLVTGATGFVGRHLVGSLVERPGGSVRILARSPQRAREVLGADLDRVEVVPGDLIDVAAVARACEGVNVVFHCAALGPSSYGPRNRPEEYEAVNVEGTDNLAAAAVGAGVERFVHVSTTGVMGAPRETTLDETTPCRPVSFYDRSKLAAEHKLLERFRRDGLPAVILRPCLIAGPGKPGGRLLQLFELCRRGRFPIFGGRLDVQKPLVDVDDVVQALLRARERGRPGEIYLVHSGARYTLEAILRVAGNLVGNPRPYLRIPLFAGLAAAHAGAVLARIIGRSPWPSPEEIARLVADRPLRIDKAIHELDYRPRHQDLEDLLGRTHAYYVRTGQLTPET